MCIFFFWLTFSDQVLPPIQWKKSDLFDVRNDLLLMFFPSSTPVVTLKLKRSSFSKHKDCWRLTQALLYQRLHPIGDLQAFFIGTSSLACVR